MRARLNVLTDLADEWLTEVQHWRQLTNDWKQNNTSNVDTPDPNDEYFIYQNLLGAYPMPGQNEDDFPNRFRLYLEKAIQEAKRHITDREIDDSYYAGIQAFTDYLLNKQGAFWARFRPFHQQIADFGIVNSLTQVLLKFTCPGVPDIYQGGEGWDFSLVDPDNRRPVDFAMRQQWLTDLTRLWQANKSGWNDLWQHRFDGRLKFWLTYLLLQERQQYTLLFAEGEYTPVLVEGTYQNYILAFARRHNADWRIIVVPLHTARLCREQDRDISNLDWADTRLVLPKEAPTSPYVLD